jgi:hypothetical protein
MLTKHEGKGPNDHDWSVDYSDPGKLRNLKIMCVLYLGLTHS